MKLTVLDVDAAGAAFPFCCEDRQCAIHTFHADQLTFPFPLESSFFFTLFFGFTSDMSSSESLMSSTGGCFYADNQV
jgi:hypothetical protein